MAERRMFSNKIIGSARFLKMPSSTQALYFHLGMQADDDGVVEAYSVMRLIGASEDDLKLLAAKGFVTVLNEDLVTYLIDWTEHNRIRPDRKTDSKYRQLLFQRLPDVQLIESRERADRRREAEEIIPEKAEEKPPSDAPKEEKTGGTSQGQPMDRIGKDSIGKVSTGKDSIYTGVRTQDVRPVVVIASLMLRDGTRYDVAENDAEKYRQLYPALDIDKEFQEMEKWCMNHPSGRKTRGRVGCFIDGWLNRNQKRVEAENTPQAPKASGNRFHNFNQRGTDYDTLLTQMQRAGG